MLATVFSEEEFYFLILEWYWHVSVISQVSIIVAKKIRLYFPMANLFISHLHVFKVSKLYPGLETYPELGSLLCTQETKYNNIVGRAREKAAKARQEIMISWLISSGM